MTKHSPRNGDKPSAARHMTPDEVLHALRHFAQLDNDSGMVWPVAESITPDTTIEEYDSVQGFTDDLGEMLHLLFFGNTVFDPDWHTALLPERTVGDLCRFLARRVTLTPLETYAVLDRPCLPGAIFLTLKARLAVSYCNVSRLAPSTPLKRYSWFSIVREASLIAPDRLPLAQTELKARRMTRADCGLLFLVLSIAAMLGWAIEGVQGMMLGVFGCVFTIMVIGKLARLFVREDHFPGARTFRDLCQLLAGEPVARPDRAPRALLS